MNDELSNYFIASSHNTYCTKYQYECTGFGKCAVGIEPFLWFLDTFHGGCVEIDVVNESDNDVLVYHACYPGVGYFNPLKLSDILQAIIKWSRAHADHFPIIVSLDLKRTDEQSVQAIDGAFKRCFASNSLLYPEKKHKYVPYTTPLMLQSTMGKILVRINTDVVKYLRFLKGRVALPNSKEHAISCDNFTDTGSHMFRTAKYKRVYPSGLFLLSQNFNPIPFWEARIQMVALNFQRNDVYTFVYEEVFKGKALIHMSEWSTLKHKIPNLVRKFNRKKKHLPVFKLHHTGIASTTPSSTRFSV